MALENLAVACRILDSRIEFLARELAVPLHLSSGAIRELTEARATVVVRTGEGKEATGHGNIYLSDLWSWPDPALTHEARDTRLRELTSSISDTLWSACGGEAAHPLELGLRLHESVCHEEDAGGPPLLSRAMCASPFDAALHDAAGQALGVSAFDLYEHDYRLPSAESCLGPHPARAIRHALVFRNKPLPAWLLVGKADDLETLFLDWVKRRGYFCFKIKILGVDAAVDAARVIEVYRAAREAGVPAPRISVDSNEANPDPQSVLEFLDILQADDASAYRALEYLEQPTARDIARNAFDWREVALRKTVLLDEGLTGLEALEMARDQGWSGLALKTCKGHSFVLCSAAWAVARAMKLTVQDLTNPGYSAIHSALLANALGIESGVEINSPQFTPAANTEWLPRLAGLFEPGDGHHTLADWRPVGLGSTLGVRPD